MLRRNSAKIPCPPNKIAEVFYFLEAGIKNKGMVMDTSGMHRKEAKGKASNELCSPHQGANSACGILAYNFGLQVQPICRIWGEGCHKNHNAF